MRVLVYEYITGGGLLAEDADCLESLRPEGEAMVTALVADFAALPQTQVHLVRDTRLGARASAATVQTHFVERAEDELPTLARLAANADWTILIAPEFDRILLERARLVEAHGGRLLSPSSRVVELCSDKMRTVAHLRARGVPVPSSVRLKPAGDRLELPRAFSYPAVVKRVDGAGSLGTRRIESPDPVVQLDSGPWMLETFVPGLPVSAAVLCGPREHVVLPPLVQHIEPGTFRYLGGTRLVDAAYESRAREWAAQVVESLPEPRGYLGVDMVLGADPSGAEDAVLEVNPRLTTSIVGLRAIARTNLAGAMLAVATGASLPLEWWPEALSFSVDGGHPPVATA